MAWPEATLLKARQSWALARNPGERLTLAGLWERRGKAEPYLYLLPAMALTILWTYWPILGTMQLAFFRWNLLPTSPKVWVGTENFEHLLALPEMGQALSNTGMYILGTIPFSIVFPLVIAILINDLSHRTRGWYRAIIFLPVLMSPVVVAVIWRWIMGPNSGILNVALHSFGLGPINTFKDGNTALWAIVFIGGWKLIGFSVLIFSAGLTSISKDYLEAAAIDGANKWQAIRHVMIPLLSPTIMFMLLMTVLLSAQWSFPVINALTQGGPRGGTTNIYFLLWEYGFRSFNIGLSSAAAIVLFIGFGGLAFVFLKLSERFSFHDS